VAGLARNLAFIAMIEQESVAGQLGGCPGGRCVAADAIYPKQTGMNGRFFMASCTV
jgi:hypothetical protein